MEFQRQFKIKSFSKIQISPSKDFAEMKAMKPGNQTDDEIDKQAQIKENFKSQIREAKR